jgi:predicted SnoaL-like aldol condensation-catalyzing enzyme
MSILEIRLQFKASFQGRIENDRIVEHWDVIEEIPPKDKWMNKNTKF